jgi:hypothetical protein
MYESLIGKDVKIILLYPIKTHFSNSIKTLYGNLMGESEKLIQVQIGFIITPTKDLSQEHVISKDIIKSIDRARWLGLVERDNKEWYKPSEDYIPSKDNYRKSIQTKNPKRKICRCKK